MADNNENSWVVLAAESGMKLLAFLKGKLSSVSGKQIKQLVDAGNCKINGKVERFSSRLVGRGDRITFYKPDAALSSALSSIAFDSAGRIIYEDDELIVYDKPAGLSSEDLNILSFIKRVSRPLSSTGQSGDHPPSNCGEGNVNHPSIQLVHRLDRDTTGILIFAKNKAMADAMGALFKQRKIEKTYLAIVDGVPKNEGVIDNFLGKLNAYQGQTLYGEVSESEGLRACTVWKRKKVGQTSSLLACYPETGRTHQIRVHLSGMGHPILGDYQYGRSFKCSFRPQRMLLHAYEIAFKHPKTHQPIHIIAQLPVDFAQAESYLMKQKE
jgi:RluA family pseudouridine synthase